MISLRLLFGAPLAALFLVLCGCNDESSPSALASASAASPTAGEPVSEGPMPVIPDPARLTDADWRELLTPEQYHVLREAGTERPFTGKYWKTDGKQGVYHCAACGLALFDSDAKFDSGTGWPSFSRPVGDEAVAKRPDTSHGVVRTENICARCKSHLGHCFEGESSAPGGTRYCINSAALRFIPAGQAAEPAPPVIEPAENRKPAE